MRGTRPSRLGAPPTLDAILSWMQKSGTVTQGWDVVCAMAFDKVNDLFVQQYVERLSNQEYAVINATVPSAGGISIEAVNLALGPPLIQLKPGLPQNTLNLIINFISGQVNVLQTNGKATTLLSTQTVTPSDDYVLTGLVPLTSVQGEVKNKHDVVIDIVNGTSFSAGLNMPEGAQTLLGQFIQIWLAKHLKGYQYKLGTLDYSNNNTNLTPAGTFQLATQTNASDPTDTGRLLLFIPTTHNPGGGQQTSLGLADVVPQGCSTALFISSQAFFQGILAPFYTSTFSKFGVQATASQSPGGSYALALTAGSLNIGLQAWSDGGGNRLWTGLPGHLTFPEVDQDVVIPLSPIGIAPSNNQLLIEGNPQWSQYLAYQTIRTRSSTGAQEFTFTATVKCLATASATSVSDLVSFKGASQVHVSSDANWWNNLNWGILEGMMTQGATAALQALFNVPLPAVNAFAVSNLLFPGKNALNFQSAYLPGDIVIFGDVAAPVTVTPPAVTLAPGQTQQFKATASGDVVTWTAQLGTVSSAGLYTPPAALSQVQTDQVVAQDSKSGATAAALITLVPQGAEVSPAFALMTAAASPQQFAAAVSGVANQNVTWSLSPPHAGGISEAGLYTPPQSVASPQAVTITATSASRPSIQGSATVVLLSSLPTDVAVTPYSVPLAPGQTQQFKAAVGGVADQSVTWSLVPPGVGKITSEGLYIAPESIATPQSTLVVATSKVVSVLFGTALVTLCSSIP
jgi:hypothetical protein